MVTAPFSGRELAKAAERPALLAGLAGFSLGISAFTGVHLALYLRRSFADGLHADERAWAALGVVLVVAGLLNAYVLRRLMAAAGTRGPGARREA